tara:strand:+ start:695 stop:811 length:117 start_codon:yes stop_codon:yes gene_type:complete
MAQLWQLTSSRLSGEDSSFETAMPRRSNVSGSVDVAVM